MADIKALAKKYSEKMIEDRRYIHMNPELGNEEYNTSAYICKQLDSIGIKYKAGIAKTGVLGEIGNGKGKCILIRADMDALPMEELNDVPYKSRNPGVCHSCGHDSHTAILLGVARILKECENEINGTVKFCFQPAEEASCGGAQQMVAENVLDGVDASIALHVDPSTMVGTAIIERGAITSYPDFFSITFKGKGAHGSFPSNGIDPIAPAVSAYNMINMIHKKISPLEHSVIQVCMIDAGTAQAVIPEKVVMQGTVRTQSLANRELVRSQLEAIAKSVCDVFGTTYEYDYRGRCMPVVNDGEMVDLAIDATKTVFDKVLPTLGSMRIGGEDFCFISDKVPSCMMVLGSSDGTKRTSYAHHNPHFDIDERALEIGASALAMIAMEYLNR